MVYNLQVYFNGHHWLVQRLTRTRIAFAMADNAFLWIADPTRAQAVAESLDARQIHRRLDRRAKRLCPVLHHFPSAYHWSFMQVELATDVVFRSQRDFQPLHESLIRSAVHTVRAEHIATFLGRRLTSAYQSEVGNDFHTRIQGTRIRHHMGPASIKLYDKAGIMARVECTAHDVSFFKHHRQVEQRDGGRVWELAPLRKNLYSLRALRRLMHAANERYLAFLATLDHPDAGLKAIDKMAKPARHAHRRSLCQLLRQAPPPLPDPEPGCPAT